MEAPPPPPRGSTLPPAQGRQACVVCALRLHEIFALSASLTNKSLNTEMNSNKNSSSTRESQGRECYILPPIKTLKYLLSCYHNSEFFHIPVSNGSSVLSGYSSSSEMHHMAPQVVEKTHQTVTTQRRVITQEPNGLQKRQQSFDEQQQQHLRDLAQLDREQQVLMTERQNTAHYQQQQQQQPASQGDRDRKFFVDSLQSVVALAILLNGRTVQLNSKFEF